MQKTNEIILASVKAYSKRMTLQETKVPESHVGFIGVTMMYEKPVTKFTESQEFFDLVKSLCMESAHNAVNGDGDNLKSLFNENWWNEKIIGLL